MRLIGSDGALATPEDFSAMHHPLQNGRIIAPAENTN
jgi:hypothetical protein